jgi:hypothetical protein
MLSCTHCKCGLVYTWTEKKGKKNAKAARHYGYYSCHRAREHGSGVCPMPHLPAQDIERMVIEEIADMCQNPQLADSVIQQADAEHVSACEQASQVLREAESHHALCLAQLQARNCERARNALAEAEAQVTLGREQLLKAKKLRINESLAREILKDFNTIWSELAGSEQRQLLRSLIRNVAIDGEQGSMRIDFISEGVAALAAQTREGNEPCQ